MLAIMVSITLPLSKAMNPSRPGRTRDTSRPVMHVGNENATIALITPTRHQGTVRASGTGSVVNSLSETLTRLTSLRFVHDASVHHRQCHPGLVNLVRVELEQVVLQHDQVGFLADFEAAYLVIGAELPR